MQPQHRPTFGLPLCAVTQVEPNLSVLTGRQIAQSPVIGRRSVQHQHVAGTQRGRLGNYDDIVRTAPTDDWALDRIAALAGITVGCALHVRAHVIGQAADKPATQQANRHCHAFGGYRRTGDECFGRLLWLARIDIGTETK